MIQIEQLTKRFRKLTVLDGISASFQPGQVVSLIGPNGSGKTTLIKCILGMVKPNSGTIRFQGTPVNGDPAYRAAIGYMPQIGRYPDNMRIGQLFRMMENLRPAPAEGHDRSLLEKFELEKIFDKPMRTLSGGTRQKVSAALAFLFRPPVLILDEPTAGLDPLSSEILKEKILAEKKKDRLILITSHVLSDLEEFTTHILYLQEGREVFFRDWPTLQEETGEARLGKAIARVMRGEALSSAAPEPGPTAKKEEPIY
jgi:Cu-processing system ATP-binding protein